MDNICEGHLCNEPPSRVVEADVDDDEGDCFPRRYGMLQTIRVVCVFCAVIAIVFFYSLIKYI